MSCASVSLYDGEGERLSTVRMARMPESKKVTLKTMVGAEVEAVLGQRPDLQLVKIAGSERATGRSSVACCPRASSSSDFFHAAQHLSDAFRAAYGANGRLAQFEKYRSAALRRRRCSAVGHCAISFEASRSNVSRC